MNLSTTCSTPPTKVTAPKFRVQTTKAPSKVPSPQTKQRVHADCPQLFAHGAPDDAIDPNITTPIGKESNVSNLPRRSRTPHGQDAIPRLPIIEGSQEDQPSLSLLSSPSIEE